MKKVADIDCIENFFRHHKAKMPHFTSRKALEEVKHSISDHIHYYNIKGIQTKYGINPMEYPLHAT